VAEETTDYGVGNNNQEGQGSIDQSTVTHQTFSPSAESATPQAPTSPANQNSVAEGEHKTALIATAVILILIIGAVVVLRYPHTTKPITSTTTIPVQKLSNINNCTVISKPGTYYLVNSINSHILKGSCISINSSNVMLVGNGNKIIGSGPYAIVPPYSYGVEIGNVSNVSIEDVAIENFSYGVYASGTRNSVINNVNATNDTMSGISLHDAVDIIVSNSTIVRASSKQGGISLQGGTGNKLLRNRLLDNIFYGASINSTGNSFDNNTFANNPADIICSPEASFVHANNFSGNICSVNMYCAFAQCRKTNLPINYSSTVLMPGKVSTCGSIVYAGNYVLANNLNAAQYLNLSNPLAKTLSCINFHAGQAHLNCNGHVISNFGIGISVNSSTASSIANCTLLNDTTALNVTGSISLNVSNITVAHAAYGVNMYNVTGGTASSIKVYNSTYGMYLSKATGIVFSNLNLSNNEYGMYVNSAESNAFSKGVMENNFKADVFCSPLTYNSTSNLFQSVSCGVTDCNWASCKSHVLPQLAMYPLTNCSTISHSGNYSLESNLVVKGDCFKISTGNIVFNCNGHSITGSGSGSAFLLNGISNVSISNCRITNFANGIEASNSAMVRLSNTNISSVGTAVYFVNETKSMVSNVTASLFSAYGFLFRKLSSSVVTGDSAVGGLSNSSGFSFYNATNNIVSFNNAKLNPAYGFSLYNFTNNSVYGNSAFSDHALDYYCSQSSSGIYADATGVNSGNTKNVCRWLIVLPKISANPPCAGISSSSSISLSSDMVYNYSGICYNIYNTNSSTANYTTINCNGHTVLAVNGGTFVNVVNATGVKVENCYIENFTSPLISHGNAFTALNNTLFRNKYAIELFNSNSSSLQDNKFSNDSIGILAHESSLGYIFNNTFNNVNTSISWNLGSASRFVSNNANYGVYGIIFNGTTSNLLKSNILENMSNSGIACYGVSAKNISANVDSGGNMCSKNANCTWIFVSPQCKPS